MNEYLRKDCRNCEYTRVKNYGFGTAGDASIVLSVACGNSADGKAGSLDAGVSNDAGGVFAAGGNSIALSVFPASGVTVGTIGPEGAAPSIIPPFSALVSPPIPPIPPTDFSDDNADGVVAILSLVGKYQKQVTAHKTIHKRTATAVILVKISPAFTPNALAPPAPPKAPVNPPPLPL